MTNFERLAYGVVAVGLIFLMTGCQAAKTVFDACRDGLCR